MRDIKYQPEIDGLRAIAVLSVLLFHLEYTFIPGGYVGVDVFFVISGFLITRILYRDVSAGDFSFKRFYSRRIRRLAPALIAVLLVTFVAACFFLTPNFLERFSGALIASVFSVSNIFFWLESGYFDASADLKPVLHTWSLSVEEQFYFVWPALLFLCAGRSRKILFVLFVVLGLISLMAARWFTVKDPTASFFLMPFRVYEFAIGAALAMVPVISLHSARPLPNALRELMCVSGLALIAYSVFIFDKTTPFPDVYALVPCVGAALLIAGGSAQVTGWALRNPVSVWLGKISYSLYLVHWPIVVLYKHITFEDVVVGKTRIALLILTLLAAVALYYLVENRFRYGIAGAGAGTGSGNKARKLAWFAVPLVLLAASAHAYTSSGWPARFDPALINAIGDIEAKQLIRRQYIEGPESLSNLPFDEAKPDDKEPLNILVVGDSHATDLFNALYFNLSDSASYSIRRLEIDDSCMYLFTDGVTDQSAALQARCERQYESVQVSELPANADRILLSMRWEAASLDDLPVFIDFISSSGAPVIILGRTAEFKSVPALVMKNGLTPAIGKRVADTRSRNLDALNDTLRALAEEMNLPFVDKVPYLCDLAEGTCDVIDEQGKILYTDYGHWTVEGARFFGARMLQDDQFSALLKQPR